MKKAFDDYRYLAGSNRSKGTIWQGPDHLLVIETAGGSLHYSETYRRVDYKNIQTLGYARTSRHAWQIVVCLIIIALGAWPLVEGIWQSDNSLIAMGGLLISPFLIFLVIELVKGPTAVCKIQTAVQVLRLKPIRRLKAAKKLVATVSELCRLHQMDIPVASGRAEAPLTEILGVDGIKEPFYGSNLITTALLCLLGAGLTMLAESFVDSILFLGLNLTLLATAGVLCVAGLAHNSRYELASGLKTSLLGGAICTFITGVVMYAFATVTGVMDTMKQVEKGRNPFDPAGQGLEFLGALARIDFAAHPGMCWTLVVLGGILLFLALLGLPAALAAARRQPSASTPPLPPQL